jgi:hypothetical protein
MPSTALIFAKLARPMTKPVLFGFPVGRFCFGIFGVYQIFCYFAMSEDGDGRVKQERRVGKVNGTRECAAG